MRLTQGGKRSFLCSWEAGTTRFSGSSIQWRSRRNASDWRKIAITLKTPIQECHPSANPRTAMWTQFLLWSKSTQIPVAYGTAVDSECQRERGRKYTCANVNQHVRGGFGNNRLRQAFEYCANKKPSHT